MSEYAQKIGRIDRLAIGLSALCGVHCLATSLLIGVMASFGGLIDSPLVHEGGLVLAIILGALALGMGALRHRAPAPIAIGSAGLGTMATALALPHGAPETIVTLAGVAILSAAHLLNRQALARP